MDSSTKQENESATAIRDGQEVIEAALVLDDLDTFEPPQFVREDRGNAIERTKASKTNENQTSISAQQPPQREAPFLPQANNENPALVENEELSGFKKVSCNESIAPCVEIKNVDKQEYIRRKHSTFIRPQNAPDMRKSVIYGLQTLLWFVYQSFVLGFIPISITGILFGTCWAFSINYENVLVYVIVFDSVSIVCIYSSVWLVLFYIFDKFRVLLHVKRIGIPFYFAHNILYCIRQIYQIPMLALIYYAVMFIHCLIIFRKIQLNEEEEIHVFMNEKERRYHILSTDGTPKAILKGFTPFVMVYYLSNYLLIPFFMEAHITIRILGRVIVMPFIYNLVDAYQNNLLIEKSIELQKYRMIAFTLMHSITMNILRFMITNPSDLTETFYMTLVSSIFDICLRISYIPRTIYIMRLLQYSKDKIVPFFTSTTKVENLTSVPPLPSSHQHPSQRIFIENRDEGHSAKSEDNRNERVQILDIEITRKGLRTLIEKLNQRDRYSQYVLCYYNNRSLFMSQFEIQSSIFLPIILYLNHPLQHYYRFQTFSSIEQVGYNILVQFSLELVSQLCCITYDYYLYGIESPISKSWKYNIKRQFFQSAVFTLLSNFMAVGLFRPGTEKWPKN